MQRAAVDFDKVALDGEQLTVSGRCGVGATVRLAPRRYKVLPRWVEVDVVVDHPGAVAATDGYAASLDVTGLWGHEGLCIVGASSRRFIPRTASSGTLDAVVSDDIEDARSIEPSEATPPPIAAEAGVLVTTLLRIDPSATDELTIALRRHPAVAGGVDGWLGAWCAIDHDRAEVVVLTRWIDEISYRRAILGDGFHHAEKSMQPLLVDDSDVTVADLLFPPT